MQGILGSKENSKRLANPANRNLMNHKVCKGKNVAKKNSIKVDMAKCFKKGF